MINKTILLADDVRLFIEIEKTFFCREDFNLLTATSGREVLEILVANSVDLVFLDLYMPGMEGDECCRVIKANPETAHIPVVIVTLSGKQEDQERCRLAGCDGIIFKPINREHFIVTANKFLNVQEREAVRYIARLQIHFGKDYCEMMCDYAINLSSGGVYLETMNLMEENTPLLAEFVLPGGKGTITCKARVAWVNHPKMMKNQNLPVGMGLQFQNLSAEDMDQIRSYIHEEQLTPLW